MITGYESFFFFFSCNSVKSYESVIISCEFVISNYEFVKTWFKDFVISSYESVTCITRYESLLPVSTLLFQDVILLFQVMNLLFPDVNLLFQVMNLL